MKDEKLNDEAQLAHNELFGKTHPKISDAMIDLLLKRYNGSDFFYYFMSKIRLIENSKMVPTAGVRFNGIQMEMVYNSKFIDKLTQPEVMFLLLHEISHLLWDHNSRATEHGYDHKVHNIATDMLINKSIVEDYEWVDMIADGVLWDKHYKGPEVTDNIYEWMMDLAEELKDKDANSKPQQGQGQGDGSGTGKPDDNEKDSGEGDGSGGGDKKEDKEDTGGGQDESPERQLEGKADKATEDMLRDYNNNEEFSGEFTDVHLKDIGNISEEMKAEIIKDVVKELKNRGVIEGNMQRLLDDRIKESRNNFLKILKKSIAQVKGKAPSKTYSKLNRRLPGKIKGKKGVANKINVILDCSGSMMGGSLEAVTREIFKDGYELNLLIADTKVSQVFHIKNKNELRGLGLSDIGGGTVLQPAVQYVKEQKWHNFGTLLLTDGYTDTIDATGFPSFLILYHGQECPTTGPKIKQIEVPDDYHKQ